MGIIRSIPPSQGGLSGVSSAVGDVCRGFLVVREMLGECLQGFLGGQEECLQGFLVS